MLAAEFRSARADGIRA